MSLFLLGLMLVALVINCLSIEMSFEKKSIFGISMTISSTVLTLAIIIAMIIKNMV